MEFHGHAAIAVFTSATYFLITKNSYHSFLFFVSQVMVDFDHILHYAKNISVKGSINPKNLYKHYGKYRDIGPHFFVLHNFYVLLLLLFLGFVISIDFFIVFLGVSVHYLIDFYFNQHSRGRHYNWFYFR